MTAPEVWLPIPGYEGYYDVSDQGRVRSWVPWRGTPVPRIVRPWVRPDGRLKVALCVPNPRTWHKVHLLVARAFIGPRPEGQQTRHLNGAHQDNRLTNLAYGTPSQNRQDQMSHGTHWQTNKTHCPSGHPYDDGNTQVTRTGHRQCRACNRVSCRTRYATKSRDSAHA